jgi:hypothetical protein
MNGIDKILKVCSIIKKLDLLQHQRIRTLMRERKSKKNVHGMNIQKKRAKKVLCGEDSTFNVAVGCTLPIPDHGEEFAAHCGLPCVDRNMGRTSR